MKNVHNANIDKMGYVELMAFLGEVNRPPGGKNSVRIIVQNCFLNKDSKVLDVGCNTGYGTFEIAHLAKCHVTGIDISREMVERADFFKKSDPLGGLVDFKIADGMNLPFAHERFDLVFSGGSTAFIKDKKTALAEYARVAKQWGFVADINFFYRSRPPARLIMKLNNLMGTDIKPWNIDYWLDLYGSTGLEKYFVHFEPVKKVKMSQIKNYCAKMTEDLKLNDEANRKLKKRLMETMTLFNRNNEYLGYGIFIYRKRSGKEQISFFGE